MTDFKRRKLMKMMGIGAASVPLTGLIASLPSHAADAPMVDPASPEAAAVDYVAVSVKEGQKCSNCTLFQGADGDAQGGCSIFAGKAVAADAWCKVWVPKG